MGWKKFGEAWILNYYDFVLNEKKNITAFGNTKTTTVGMVWSGA